MSNENQKFKKVLSSYDILALAFGAMIGWGWVVLSADWLSAAGVWGSIIAFLIGGVLVLFVGFVYSELTSAMPKTGGGQIFIHRALGSKWAFIGAWTLALGYVSVVAFEAVALPQVIEYLFPNYKVGYLWTIAEGDVYASWAAVGMAGALIVMLFNYRGMKEAAIFQTIVTVLLGLVGLFLIFGGLAVSAPADPVPSFIGGIGGIMAVAIMTPFMFVGFDVIPQTAEETNLPYKKIGKILILSVVMAVLFYVGVIFATGSGLGQKALGESTLATADALASIVGADWGGVVLILGGIGGILTSWNAFLIGGSRILYAMSHAKMLPAWFGKLHPKYKTPSNAILFIGILSFFAPLFGRPMLVWLVDAGGLAIVITYLLVSISFVVLRKREPDMPRPFRAGKSSIIGYLAILMTFGMGILYMPGMPSALVWPAEWIIFGGWMLIGLIFLAKTPNLPFEKVELNQEQLASGDK
jgi:APA family basic amino acid/polyamine antiporter